MNKKKFLKKDFSLGSLTLTSNILCAPLAGCSDVPFRRMTAKYKPGLVYCEMVKMEALIRKIPQTFRLLEYDNWTRPIGAQICGSNPKIAGECARMIEELGFDIIDLNCGCPVDKITKDGSGSGLLKQPEVIGEILANMIAAVKIPVTVKIRAGWDENSIIGPEVTKIAESAGAVALCVHGRTREQGYRGPANWDYIKACKQAADKMKVIGNGDVTTPLQAEEMFSYTDCDAILLARGTMGQPWLIEDIYDYFEKGITNTRTAKDLKENFLEHFEHIVSYQDERKAVLDLRRVGCWFLKGGKRARSFREALNHTTTINEIRTLLASYSWEEISLSSEESDSSLF